MKFGNCKLCKQDRDLQDSHLMPRSLYKKARGTGTGNTDPVSVTAAGARQTSYQITDYVFCRECEARLNLNGEEYVLSLVATNTTFPLLEKLSGAATNLQTSEWKAYTQADTPEINRTKLAYFGMSVLWRASVHAWENEDGKKIRIDLGAKYNEQIRKYLMGEIVIPPLAWLTVDVCSDIVSQHSHFPPGENTKSKERVFGFLARGILFWLGMGKSVADRHRRLAMTNNPRGLIKVYDCTKHTQWALRRSTDELQVI